MSLWTGFTKILGQGLAIIGGAIGVNVDGTTITINDSNQLVSSGGGGVPVTGPFEYVNTEPLTDGSSNLYYGTGAYLSDASGNLYYSDGQILADSGGSLYYDYNNKELTDGVGTLYYGNGNKLADHNGHLYYSNGNTITIGGGSLTATSIYFNTSQTTTNGSTSGSTVSSMPFTGTAYKKVVIYVNALVNATSTSYTFPTVFTTQPAFTYIASGDASLLTLSTTTVTFAVGTFSSGWIIIEGY